MSELVFTVDTENPRQLKNYLRDNCQISAGLLRRLKNDGGIFVNGNSARTVDMVQNGDTITLRQIENSEIEANPALDVPVVFENDSVVVFDKPAGMPVHPSARHRTDTLGNFFAARYGELVFRPVNRLDKDTSGLCLVAKNSHSANILQGCTHKIYYAAVEGITDKSGTIDAPIARVAESIITRCVREDGRNAVTHYKKIREGNGCSLLEILLETGRTHQIRVHFSHIGFPLAGDDLYGGSRKKITRQALHCGKMCFVCPATHEKITVEAPLPQDISELFR
ncbi:MAG: RluA family pseudouridine synthase [Ruminococcus sp.]|nr:RluA family pseudouridine synthase [Ruminococcus sp.]